MRLKTVFLLAHMLVNDVGVREAGADNVSMGDDPEPARVYGLYHLIIIPTPLFALTRKVVICRYVIPCKKGEIVVPTQKPLPLQELLKQYKHSLILKP